MSSTLSISRLISRKKLATYKTALAIHDFSDSFWQLRPCLQLPPDTTVWETAENLAWAADALLAGDRETAIEGICASERFELLAWGVPIMSVVKPDIIRWRPIAESMLPLARRLDSGCFKPRS